MWIMGIDPGLTGAMAFYAPASDSLAVYDMPTWRREVDVDEIAVLIRKFGPCLGVIERNWGKPSRASTFNLGAAYSALQLSCAGLVEYHLVAPTTWRAHFGLRSAGKDLIRQRARELWPKEA